MPGKLIVKCPSGREVWLVGENDWIKWLDAKVSQGEMRADVEWLYKEGCVEYAREYYKYV